MLVGYVLSFIALAIYATQTIIERWSRNEKRKNTPLSSNNRRNRE